MFHHFSCSDMIKYHLHHFHHQTAHQFCCFFQDPDRFLVNKYNLRSTRETVWRIRGASGSSFEVRFETSPNRYIGIYIYKVLHDYTMLYQWLVMIVWFYGN